MAEIFGAVVSGIGLLQLSAELLDGAKKLKDFSKHVRDASAILRNLSLELKTISLLLRNLEQYRQQDGHDAEAMEQCISMCRERTTFALARIEKLDERLQKHSRYGKASVAFNEKELKSMLEDLERWKSAIQIAAWYS